MDPIGKGKCVLVYDGECAFCRSQVARIQRRSAPETFEFVPSQTPGLEDRFPVLRGADFNTGMRLVLPNGEVRVGADAVYEVARRVPGWRHLVWLYRVPGLKGVARVLYRWVAAHRQKFGRRCSSGRCGT